MNNYPQGVVITKTHPTLKNGQIVYVIEVTPDLYRVKITIRSKPEIISKSDLRML
jgi:hypothetical protein